MSQIEELLVDSSRAIADIAIVKIGAQQNGFDEVVDIIRKDQYPLAMRAARIIQIIGIQHPSLVRKHIPEFLVMLRTTRVDGVKRAILKIFADCPLYFTEDQWGEMADIAFEFADDRNQSIAVRAFAVDILVKLIKIYPELKPELIAILESMYPDGSVGLKNKCRKLLKKLRY